jgi:hypothetical protein
VEAEAEARDERSRAVAEKAGVPSGLGNPRSKEFGAEEEEEGDEDEE